MSADLQFKTLIDRILRCREAEDAAKEDTKEVYAELKAMGFDKTAAGALVAELRKRDKNPEKFEERSTILDLYRDAYERASHAHTREATATILPDPQTSGAADGQRSEPSSDAEGAKSDSCQAVVGRAGEEPGSAYLKSEQAVTYSPSPQPAPSSPTVVSPADPGSSSPDAGSAGTPSDDDIPAFLRKSAEPVLNDRCERPHDCKFSHHPHKVTCSTCSTAWAIEQRKAREAA